MVPNAAKTEIVGWLEEGVLKVKVKAPPEGGRANREVIKLMTQFLQLPRREVVLVSGEKSRNKVLGFAGLSEGDLLEKLPPG